MSHINWKDESDEFSDINPLRKHHDEEYDGNLFVSSSMQEDIGGNNDIESLREGSIIVDGIMDTVRLTDINIACDAALDQDINQEIGFLGEERIDFFQYEEQKDSLVIETTPKPTYVYRRENVPSDEEMMEIYGLCPVCRGSGETINPDGPGMEQCYNPDCFNGELRKVDPNEVV